MESKTLESPNDSGNSTSKSKKRKLLKKAPNAPKRFKSAYICFITQNMDEMKNKLGQDSKVTDVTKELAKIWKNLPSAEKNRYISVAEADKAR